MDTPDTREPVKGGDANCPEVTATHHHDVTGIQVSTPKLPWVIMYHQARGLYHQVGSRCLEASPAWSATTLTEMLEDWDRQRNMLCTQRSCRDVLAHDEVLWVRSLLRTLNRVSDTYLGLDIEEDVRVLGRVRGSLESGYPEPGARTGRPLGTFFDATNAELENIHAVMTTHMRGQEWQEDLHQHFDTPETRDRIKEAGLGSATDPYLLVTGDPGMNGGLNNTLLHVLSDVQVTGKVGVVAPLSTIANLSPVILEPAWSDRLTMTIPVPEDLTPELLELIVGLHDTNTGTTRLRQTLEMARLLQGKKVHAR